MRLGQRRGEQAQDQLLVGLAAGEDRPCARARRRAAGRAAGRAPWPGSSGRARPRARRRRAGSARPPRPRPAAACASRCRTGSPSLRRTRARASRRASSGSRRALHRAVVGDVARGLLEVGGQPAALEQLGHHVRHVLAGDVRAAELGHGVVAVAEEDALVELGRALALLAVERPGGAGAVGGELVEVQAAQRALVARVAGEQRALHGLRQVDQREHGRVEVREVGLERGALGFAEGLDGVVHGGVGQHRPASGGRRRSRRLGEPAAPARTPGSGRRRRRRVFSISSSIRRPSMCSVPTWLSNHGPPSHMRQRIDGSRTPAARDSARVSAAPGG